MNVARTRRPVSVLIADDDEEDRLMIREAFETCGLGNPLHFVEDGEACLAFLEGREGHAAARAAPRPGLVFLDLKMPGMNGFEVLEALKGNPDLRRIPVVVMTTSDADEDVARSYDLGASGYVKKPVTFNALVKAIEAMGEYWFETVDLPREAG